MEYQNGQLIRVRGVNSRRLAAILLVGFATAFALRAGTTVITTGPRPVANAGCTCNIKGGGGHAGGGGGVIIIGG
jgi:hypothetical protein